MINIIMIECISLMNGKIAVSASADINRSIVILYRLLIHPTMLSVLRKYKLFAAGNLFYERNVHSSGRLAQEKFFNERFNHINQVHTWGIIPLLGFLIPFFTGLLRIEGKSAEIVLFHISFYIAVASVIYKGNMFFLRHFRMELRGSDMPYGKLILLHFFVNISYSCIVSIAFLSTWNSFVNHEPPFDKQVMITTLVVLVCVLMINNIYELLFLNIENRIAGRKMKELETEKTRAELQALNSHLDPHFLYNALNALSYLLRHNHEKADLYNKMLAEVYSYVLQKKKHDIVSLDEELVFCKHYFAIQQLRFGNAVQMTIEKDLPDQKQNCHVPPLSIQILIENAFKHNIFSETAPLVITVTATREQVTVTNTLKAKKHTLSRAGTGLLNLDNRLQFIGNTSLTVDRSEKHFSVSFPIIQ